MDVGGTCTGTSLMAGNAGWSVPSKRGVTFITGNWATKISTNAVNGAYCATVDASARAVVTGDLPGGNCTYM